MTTQVETNLHNSKTIRYMGGYPLIGSLPDFTKDRLGLYFAMMEGHLLLATIAQRVSFSLVPGQAIEPDPAHHVALRPAGAVNVTVRKR